MDEGFNLDGFDDLLMDGAAGAIVPRSDQHPPPANNNPTSTSQPPHQPPPFPHTPAVALQAIPGPAGRLAAQLPSPNATNTFEDEEEMYNEPQENVNECEAWRAALDALDVPCTGVWGFVWWLFGCVPPAYPPPQPQMYTACSGTAYST